MYLSVFIKNLKQQLMYRSEFFLKIGGNVLYIYVQICIWRALLGAGSEMAAQVSIQYMITYVIVANIIRQLSRTSFARIFDEKVRKGDIAIDFVRPINLKFYWFAEQSSENICTAIFSCVPVLIISSLVWGLIAPSSIIQLFQFGLSLIFAITLSYYIEYISGLCIFWTKDSTYSIQIVSGLKTIFSGAFIPLWFYPDWLYSIARILPFRMMSYEPIQIFLGRIGVLESWNVLALQFFWILIFYALEQFVWSFLKKEVVVNGG
jgi:ABC-2 type transport system permease protein